MVKNRRERKKVYEEKTKESRQNQYMTNHSNYQNTDPRESVCLCVGETEKKAYMKKTSIDTPTDVELNF